MALTVTIPYEDYKTLVQDASDKANTINILNTKFPDDTCQLIAIKSVLGIEEKKDEPVVDEPTIDDPTTDDTEPSEPPVTPDDSQEGDTNGTE